ncbi:MAG: ribonuclease III [Deltaproteobacteria bacterium]|nr:ribonuclease III [Deltaproteobacteria bacterium]
MNATTNLNELQDCIGYAFKDNQLLSQALHHRSFVNELTESDARDNECLEFLGDAVLSLIVGHMLMKRYPDFKEGDLSRVRAGMVNEKQLAEIAVQIDLGAYLKLGKGEILTQGREKKSILADALEALLGAVYLDGGFEKAFAVVHNLFTAQVEAAAKPAAHRDYKSRLQELIQGKHHMTPCYQMVDESGPDHDKTFRIQISLGDLTAEGFGKSKKAAEQDAACRALELLEAG